MTDSSPYRIWAPYQHEPDRDAMKRAADIIDSRLRMVAELAQTSRRHEERLEKLENKAREEGIQGLKDALERLVEERDALQAELKDARDLIDRERSWKEKAVKQSSELRDALQAELKDARDLIDRERSWKEKAVKQSSELRADAEQLRHVRRALRYQSNLTYRQHLREVRRIADVQVKG